LMAPLAALGLICVKLERNSGGNHASGRNRHPKLR
jgi:hypothetical protein